MKVKPEHVAYLREQLEPYYTYERWDQYQEECLSETRFLWDALYAARLSAWLVDTLYNGYNCNDNHIDTALRKIWRDIQKDLNEAKA